MTIRISIARDFSSSPSGRFPEDGPFSGERFRDEFLLPALKANDSVEVILDGVSGFGSSFLEEAFGGLVRIHHLAKEFLSTHLLIKFDDPALVFYADSITDFINEAVEE